MHEPQSDADDIRPASDAERPTRPGCTARTAPRGTRPRNATSAGCRGDRADPLRREQPVPARGSAHRQPARALPARHPPAVRGRAGHAVAVEPGRGRGGGRRLQPADARARRRLSRRSAHRPDGSWPTSSTHRPSWMALPTCVHGTRGIDLAAGPRRVGGGHLSAPRARRPPGSLRGPSRRVAVRRRRRRPLGRDGLRLLRRRRGLEAGGRPSTSTGCRSRRRAELEVRPGLDARRGRHRARSAPGFGSNASTEHPSTGGAATPTSAPRSAAAFRCRSRCVARRAG